MVQIPKVQRLALGNRQLLGGLGSNDDDDDGLLGGLLGGGNDNTKTATATRTTPNSVPTATGTNASRPPTIPSQSASTGSTATSSSSTSSSSSAASASAAPATDSAVSTSTSLTTSTSGQATDTPTVGNAAAATSAAASSSAGSGQSKGFLDNKPLSGAVFGVVGVIGLIIIVALITFSVRRSRRKKLVEEAVSFNPTDMFSHSANDFNRHSTEKAGYYNGSDSGHSHAGAAYTAGAYGPPSATGYGTTYDQPYAGYYSNNTGYGSAQQYGNQYGNPPGPVQLPSANVSSEQTRGARIPPPALLPQMAVNTQLDNNQVMAAGASRQNSPVHGHPQPPGIPSRRASDTGSVSDNPYGGAHEYKVANV